MSTVGLDPSISEDERAEDFALSRVPMSARYHWLSVAVMRFGQLSALSQFLLGATLGYGMSFWNAFWAFTLGAVILELVSALAGWIGMKEGLQTSLLSRWTGFGEIGSGILGLLIGVSVIGWFGVQNAVFASGLEQLLGTLPLWAWSIISGLFVVIVVYFGVASMGWTAYIAVPAFLLVSFFSIGKVFTQHSLGELVASPAPGPHLSIAAGATIVAGGFIVGGVIAPDMTRFNRSVGDVFKQTIVGFTVGEYTIGMIGVLLAHALKSSNVISLVISTSGVIGTIILVASTIKINDWNLYDASLGIVNAIEILFHRKVSRKKTTLVAGGLGILLSALGILNHFISFLSILGVATPPVASIMIVDYFLLKRQRKVLHESRKLGVLPSKAERWNPVGIAAWIGGFLVGQFVHWGIASVNSLIVAAVIYYVGGALFLKKSSSEDAELNLVETSRLEVE